MKLLKILFVVLAVLVVVAGIGLFLVNRYLQSPAFKDTALAAARSALGADVQVAELDVSLFSGVTLRGIKIANPAGFNGNLLEARSFVVHYRLWPLLQKRVAISELSLDQATIALVRNEQGKWNYETIGGEKANAGAGTNASTSTATSKSPSVGGMDVTLSRLALNNGTVVMRKADGKSLIEVNRINLSSTAEFVGARLGGSGEARIETLNLANALFARSLRTPITIAPDKVSLSPLSGKLAEGKLGGSLTVQLSPAFQYLVDLQVQDTDVAKLLQEAGTKPVLTGRLQGTIKLAGSGGLDTINGNGRFEIVGGQLQEIPLLKLLATLLQVPELQQLKFDECVLEFTIADNQMQTPVIRLTAPKIKLTGKGVVALSDYSLNHDLTLAIEKSLLAKVPQEIRSAFTAREDGYLAIDFKVTGPYDHPKTDLSQRLLKGATSELIQKGLKKWLK